MQCPKCGSQVSDGSKFCGECGTPLAEAAAVTGPPVPSGAAVPPREPVAQEPAAPVSPVMPASPQASAPTPSPQTPPDFGSSKPKRGIAPVIGVVAAVIAVVVVAFFAFRGSGTGGSGRGYASADDVARHLTQSVDGLMSGDVGANSMADFANAILDDLPDGAVDAMMRRYGYTSRDDLSRLLESSFGGLDEVSGALSLYLDKIDMSIQVTAADALDSDDLAGVNDGLSALGLDARATEGRELEMGATITLKEDMLGMSAGESISDDGEDTGLCAIKVDGRWFLWGSSF